jgi:hypothetical protein
MVIRFDPNEKQLKIKKIRKSIGHENIRGVVSEEHFILPGKFWFTIPRIHVFCMHRTRKKPTPGNSHLKLCGMRKKKDFIGFYRDYSIRDHSVICHAADKIDCIFFTCLISPFPPPLESFLS